ncbi:sulfotransferase domain-containing protein [Leptothoe kymatousa]|uniref:Sulfotransferase domain-containing protein n=1 Tax=Leptothoe kymatousa TAU-MAC 1615 TaxID=2364775 RepID=A0ABS5Y3S0_9CYAN|nr:sulfotransferase domain-containing protein [Leptothoe kymatousa]MBT9312462.1 sulfotransferase domain-containing protein [Leptothoe kymatousa TAU-MAC 1615]
MAFKLDFLAIGPQKTGTTWLYQKIADDSNICFPKNVKETMFFDIFYAKGLSRYLSYFPHRSPHQLCGEIAPSYFDVKEVPERIYNLNPDCKIIITLRAPAARTFSLYCHHLRKGRVPKDFSAAIQKMPRILESGRYSKYIPIWLERFSHEKVLFILMDDIILNPQKVLEDIYSFLGLPKNYLETVSSLESRVNAAGMPKFPMLAKISAIFASNLRAYRLDKFVEIAKKLGFKKVFSGGEDELPAIFPKEVEYLNNYYYQDIKYVENLVGRSLPNWILEQ